MNLRTLQYLVALADYKHFGKAAEACFVSQPTLSMQIKKLEEYLDLQLIERTNKSMQLTQVGEEVVERARVILHDLDQLKDFARYAQDPLAGECRLGIIHTVAPYLLPIVMPKLKRALPNLSIYLIEGQTDPLTLQLLQGDCDALILALPVDHPQIQTMPLYHEPFYLAVAKEHPLAKRKIISLEDLHGQDILLLKEGHCLRAQALEVCHKANLAVHEHFQATSLETLRLMVASGLGITLIPALAKLHDRSKQIAYIPFKKPMPERTVGLCWRKTNTRTALFHAIADVITSLTKLDELKMV